MATDLVELVQRLGRPRVLVVGDVMLDRYVWGNAERISQEAPVILLRADTREERLGGASSVATMLAGSRRRDQSRSESSGRDADGLRARQILEQPRHRHRGRGHRLGAADDREGALHRPGAGAAPAADDPRRLREPRAGQRRRSNANSLAPCDREDSATPTSCSISDYDKGVCTPALLAEVDRGSARPRCEGDRRPDARRRLREVSRLFQR